MHSPSFELLGECNITVQNIHGLSVVSKLQFFNNTLVILESRAYQYLKVYMKAKKEEKNTAKQQVANINFNLCLMLFSFVF